MNNKHTKYTRLTQSEREEISRGFSKKESINVIARHLGRSPSTVSREVARLRYNPQSYRSTFSHEVAMRHRNRRQITKLASNSELLAYVRVKMALQWSPEQISNRLRIEYSEDMTMRISHEAIYTYIYYHARGDLKTELRSYLRQKKRHRGRYKRDQNQKRAETRIPDLVSIHERPLEVEGRHIPGHWEGDLIVGKNHKSAIGTLVERTTRATIIVPLEAKDAESVAIAFSKAMRYIPDEMRLTLTYDRGSEMTRHKLFSDATNMKVYFADPQAPYQRGLSENTNGLIRWFFPKGTDFRNVTPKEMKHVQHLLNGRPRKVLGFHTPYEEFNRLLAKKGEVLPETLMLR